MARRIVCLMIYNHFERPLEIMIYDETYALFVKKLLWKDVG
jgi:hypothetical protein